MYKIILDFSEIDIYEHFIASNNIIHNHCKLKKSAEQPTAAERATTDHNQWPAAKPHKLPASIGEENSMQFATLGRNHPETTSQREPTIYSQPGAAIASHGQPATISQPTDNQQPTKNQLQ